MSTVTVQMFTHHDAGRNAYERIAEINGPGFGGFYHCDYTDTSQIAERVIAAFGVEPTEIKILREIEPTGADFDRFRRMAKASVHLTTRLNAFR